MPRPIDADALESVLESAIEIQEIVMKNLGLEDSDYSKAELKAYKDILNGVKEAPTIGGWISVKDRLPETGALALVFGSAGAMTVARYIAGG